jgi:hypothetical protein
MGTTAQRQTPLIVVAGPEGTAALVKCVRAQRALVYLTCSPEGCLRVATSVRSDVILLPRDFPRRIVRLLQQHPTSAGARMVWFQRLASDDAVLLGDDDSAAERARSRNPVDVLARQLSSPAHENVVTAAASDSLEHARQLASQEVARMLAQLAGECLERSVPASR